MERLKTFVEVIDYLVDELHAELAKDPNAKRAVVFGLKIIGVGTEALKRGLGIVA